MKKAVFGVLIGSVIMCSMVAMVPKTGNLYNNGKTHQVLNDTTPSGKHKKTDTSSYPKDTTRVTQDLK